MTLHHGDTTPHSDMFTGFERWTDPDLRSPIGKGRDNDYFVCFDTNILLSLYKSGPAARQEILASFKALGDRLFAPNETIKEFWKLRAIKINEQYNKYDGTREALLNAKSTTISNMKEWFNRNVPISNGNRQESVDDLSEIMSEINSLYDRLLDNVQASREKFIDFPRYTLVRADKDYDMEDADTESPTEDPIVRDLAEIFKGKVGKAPTESEKAKLEKDFKKAEGDNRRPGMTDTDKTNNDKMGDFLIWRQVLDEAQRLSSKGNKPIDAIFVTGELKLDWWRNESYFTNDKTGKKAARKTELIGANPDLIEDYVERIDGLPYVMKMDTFLEFARENLKVAISESTMEATRKAENADTKTSAKISYGGLRSLRGGDELTAIYDFETRRYTVPEGGIMAGCTTPSLKKKQPNIATLREELIEDGTVTPNDRDPIYRDNEGNVIQGTYIFTKDFEFSSHNKMAATITGQFGFSKDRWTTVNGESLSSLIAEYDDNAEEDDE